MSQESQREIPPHEQRERRFLAQLAIADVLAEADHLLDVVPGVLAAICNADGWQAGGVWWVEEEGEGAAMLWCQAMWSCPDVAIAELEVASRNIGVVRGEDLPGEVWETGETVWVEDVREDGRSPRFALAAEQGFRSACAFPIRDGDDIVGVIELHAAAIRRRSESTLELMRLVGAQIGRFVGRRREQDALHGGRTRREMAAALEESQLRLIEADRLAALGSLAGGVAHQINNALTSARLSLARLVSFELSRRPLTPVRLHRIELLQEAREGIERVERVARELRSFSRVEDEPVGPVDIHGVLDGVISLTSHEIQHRARLVCDYGEVPPVIGKSAALRQVFLNLLINAAQAIPDGHAHVNEIRVSTHVDGQGRVVVEVADTGTGAPPELVARIFEPFFTTRAPGEGIGLGLTICRDTVTAMGGEISAESKPGRGTTLRLALPSAARRDAVSTKQTLEQEVSPDDGPRGRLLIVDDDRPVAAAIALELDEYDVVVAGSGREALEILRKDPGFDVVLCDLMMPEISGMDLYETLAPVERGLAERFVFMTGGAFTQRAQSFLGRVPNTRIEKPFQAEDLRTLVDAMASQHSGEKGRISGRHRLGGGLSADVRDRETGQGPGKKIKIESTD
jgi:signal transduction histidine kinase/ActR/RegA family two-component response regulator